MTLPEGVLRTPHSHFDILTIDTQQASFKGFKWIELGTFGRRKFENMLFLQQIADRPIKVTYV